MKQGKIYVILLACILLISGTYCFITNNIENNKKEEIIKSKEEKMDFRSNIKDKYTLYGKINDIKFFSEDEDEISINDFNGKNVIFTYWDSEFEDSKFQISIAEKLKNAVQQLDNVEYVLVHRSDENNSKVRENAVKYLKDNNIDVKLIFDSNMNVHSKLGIKSVPATFSIDKEGHLVTLNEGVLSDESSIVRIVNKIKDSGSNSTEKFVMKNMINAEGGVNITFNNGSLDTVLSESQGIMIEYANLKGNKELFESTLNYINKYMKNDSLISWKVENNEASRVNAAIDDLRVYDALYNGEENFGIKEKDLKAYSRDIYKYNVENNNLVDCYDFDNNQKSNRFTLCYGDFNALNELWAENWKFKKVYSNTIDRVKNGYINDEFPLYYSWYNYNAKQYEKDDLNISEALVTILHLSEVGQEKPETISWLKKQVEKGTLYGKYSVLGNVIDGYQYESTAAYALAALIGIEVNDCELINNAVIRMEKMKINDSENLYYGAFGNMDGSGIYSFDQCMALLAYAKLEK